MAAKASYTTGEVDEAKKNLQWVVDHAKDDESRDIARLRLAGVLIDEKKYDDALKLLSAKPSDAYSMLYADRRGDILALQGKKAEARSAYTQALEKTDAQSPYRRLIEVKLDALGEAK
jgi:predicted negative regulator of RcsB-dependent stress response